MPCTTIRRTLAHLVLGAVAPVVLLVGFGEDGDAADGPAAQPAPAVTTFGQGSFEDLPLPPRATPVSERAEEDGVVSRSYEVRNSGPDALLSFYRDALAEHPVVEEPEEIGVGTHRGRWDLDGRQLTVVAQTAETLDDNPGAPEVLTQLSLSLRDGT